MKTVKLLALIICLPLFALGAPRIAPWGLYGDLQIARTNFTGIKGGINFLWQEKHSIGISLAWTERYSRNTPGDYDQYRPQTWFGSPDPLPDNYYSFTLSYGHYYPIGS